MITQKGDTGVPATTGGGVGVTVSTKAVEAVSAPSGTVTVMVAEPLAPTDGTTRTVRAPAAPPKEMDSSGTSEVFEDLPLRVSAAAGVWPSATVTGIGPVVVSWAMERSYN